MVRAEQRHRAARSLSSSTSRAPARGARGAVRAGVSRGRGAGAALSAASRQRAARRRARSWRRAMPLSVGDAAECRVTEPGFVGAWYPCRVTKLMRDGRLRVVHSELLEDDGTPSEEVRQAGGRVGPFQGAAGARAVPRGGMRAQRGWGGGDLAARRARCGALRRSGPLAGGTSKHVRRCTTTRAAWLLLRCSLVGVASVWGSARCPPRRAACDRGRQG